ncbi:expressed unknown protein [Seminavis robusta]|uniref:Uncharacterized protein n=1 Tax=Seminavis robusta TaxID=568900 RepID=A0A9N8F2W7_9STRA|nr:expressed unknown protein [Seminavis robusta]|eukprot:Sro4242_g353500.1 n/a (120) ;mRNA; f:175-534
MSPPFDSLLFADILVWVLPFVGVGQYTFLGAVNKKMNQLYKEYCEIDLNNTPRMVNDYPGILSNRRPAETTDTLCSGTFGDLPRTEYWHKDNSSNKRPDREYVCNVIAALGNITVMQWA